MNSSSSAGFGHDHDQYRKDVLLLPSEEAELSRHRNLLDQARQLGLEIPDVDVVVASRSRSLTPNNRGEVSSSVLPPSSSSMRSSSANAGRHSSCDTTTTTPGCRETFNSDKFPSSLSDYAAPSSSSFSSSNRAMPGGGGGPRRVASLHTRPTYKSTEGRSSSSSSGGHGEKNHRNHSTLNVVIPERLSRDHKDKSPVASDDKREKRRRSLATAFEKIYSHTRRPWSPHSSPSSQSHSPSSPSAAPLTAPSTAPSRVRSLKEPREGNESHAESKNDDASKQDPTPNTRGREIVKVDIPVFDAEAMRRSLNDPELAELLESHKAERNRHLAFQASSLVQLRRKQQAALDEMLSQNKKLQDDKRERNNINAARMEERQLGLEMDQRREFERNKMNSRTRIKHMEGYFDSHSPPPPPPPPQSPGTTTRTTPETTNTNTNTNNNEKTNTTHPHRQFTPQQKVQLAQEYHDYESMDRLHEAKIKVLRDRQERRLQDSIARTEKELDDMIGLHARNFAALRQEHRREEARLLQVLDGERAKMRWRWGVEEAVLRRRLEGRHQVVFGPLPEVSFEGGHGHGSGGGGGDVRDETRDSAICVSGDEYNAKMVANADANPDADANANANANAAGGDGKSQEESTESSASTPGPTPQQ